MKLQVRPTNSEIYFFEVAENKLVGLKTYRYRHVGRAESDFWWTTYTKQRSDDVELMIPAESILLCGEKKRRKHYIREKIQINVGATLKWFDCRTLQEFTGLVRGSDETLWFLNVPSIFNPSHVMFFDGANVSVSSYRLPFSGDEVDQIVERIKVRAEYVDEDEMFKLYCDQNAGSRIEDEKIEDPLAGMLRGFPFAKGDRLMFARFV